MVTQHIGAGSREMRVVLEGSIRSIMAHLQRMDLGCVLLCGMWEVNLLQPCSLQTWWSWAQGGWAELCPREIPVWTGNDETSRTWVGCGHRRGVVMPCVVPTEVSRSQILWSQMKSEILP